MPARCRHYFEFGVALADILSYLTTKIVEPLLQPELVERLGYYLNYNLVDMVEKAKVQVRLTEYVCPPTRAHQLALE
jgi:hypothetical protein